MGHYFLDTKYYFIQIDRNMVWEDLVNILGRMNIRYIPSKSQLVPNSRGIEDPRTPRFYIGGLNLLYLHQEKFLFKY